MICIPLVSFQCQILLCSVEVDFIGYCVKHFIRNQFYLGTVRRKNSCAAATIVFSVYFDFSPYLTAISWNWIWFIALELTMRVFLWQVSGRCGRITIPHPTWCRKLIVSVDFISYLKKMGLPAVTVTMIWLLAGLFILRNRENFIKCP